MVRISCSKMFRFTKIACISFVLFGCQQSIDGNKYSYDKGFYLDYSIRNTSLVVLHVYKSDGTKVTDIDTDASDAMKWAAGFSPSENIVILYSSDIGNKAWYESTNWKEVKTTAEIDRLARSFYDAKYHQFP